jgi:tetratricopeptide (TPR) repeat protein
MRGFFICVASLAAGIFYGSTALAQAPAEGSVTQGGQPDENTGRDGATPSLPEPFSRFDFDRLWRALPGKRAEEGLGQEGLKEGRRPAPGQVPKPAVSEAEQLKQDLQLKKALAPKPAPEALRKQMLDALFVRLRNASGIDDAQKIAGTIERLWLHSHSDTANLLMQRATAQVRAQRFELALSLLDKLVVLEPDWAEAWNQRATIRFLTGDKDGAMADIGRVMKLEPRHFGALAGMGMILQGAGLDKDALVVFNKVLSLYPLEPDIKKLSEKLTLEVEGQDI